MLLLPAPTHYRNRRSGYHVAITCGNDSGQQICKIAKDYGCPDSILPKVHACITHSGRYDCIVTSLVPIPRLVSRVEDLGGNVVVTRMADLLEGRA